MIALTIAQLARAVRGEAVLAGDTTAETVVSGIQDQVTEERNSAWVGRSDRVLVDQVEDGVPVGRSHRQAPEIDGVVRLDQGRAGDWVDVEYVAAYGSDMEGVVIG